MRDNGFNVIVGQSKAFMKDWDRAIADGWKPGKTLFEIEEAAQRGTIIEMLVIDAAQRIIWPDIKKHLKPGKALYFSHGFSIVYKDQTRVIPPKDVDVIMVAPKGSGHVAAPQFPLRRRHQRQLCRVPGRDRPGERALHRPWHRHRRGISLPHHL